MCLVGFCYIHVVATEAIFPTFGISSVAIMSHICNSVSAPPPPPPPPPPQKRT